MSNLPHPVDLHVGKRLRLIRQVRGITQQKLADRVGVTFQQIQKYEKGTNRIGASRLFEFSRALDVGVSFFFDGLEETPAQRLADGGRGHFQDSVFTSKEIYDIAQAFERIENPALRRKIVELIQVTAEDCSAGGKSPDGDD